MRSTLIAVALLTTPLAGTLQAAVPHVVTDTAPVHALVSMVLGDLGEAARLIPAGSSPHDAALRPSDAAALANADLVIWTGEALLPQLSDAIGNLAKNAQVISLLDSPDWPRLPLRDHAIFTVTDEHDDHDHHDHDHDHDHEDGHHHGEAGDTDPHGWLSPSVAHDWINVIEDALSQADPENTKLYQDNAAAAQGDIALLYAEIAALLEPIQGRSYLVAHDAYQYFEYAFAMPASGAITLSDASGAGPAHIAALRGQLAEDGITCILADPQTPADLLHLVTEGSDAKSATADPDGQTLEAGPALYGTMLRGIATALTDCLS